MRKIINWAAVIGAGTMKASAGIEELKNNIPGFHRDNKSARYYAEAIVNVPDYDLDLDKVQTNIVMWKLITDRYTPQELVARLEAKIVRNIYLDDRLLRAVINNGISTADIEQAV